MKFGPFGIKLRGKNNYKKGSVARDWATMRTVKNWGLNKSDRKNKKRGLFRI